MDLDRAVKELSPKDIIGAQGMARADLFRKLEMLWAFCEEDLAPGKIKPDMRKAALALQVIKEQGRLFMLDRPLPDTPEEDPEAALPRDRDTAAVMAGLLELEARATGT